MTAVFLPTRRRRRKRNGGAVCRQWGRGGKGGSKNFKRMCSGGKRQCYLIRVCHHVNIFEHCILSQYLPHLPPVSFLLKFRHLGSSTAANWVSFDLNVSCSSCWGYSLINTLKLKFQGYFLHLHLSLYLFQFSAIVSNNIVTRLTCIGLIKPGNTHETPWTCHMYACTLTSTCLLEFTPDTKHQRLM